MGRNAAGIGLALVVGLGCGGEDEDFGEPTDRAACTARPPGSGAIVVHYGALHETDPAPAFFDALAGDAETVVVTRALAPDCDGGPFAAWRDRGDRFRWAYKLPDDEAANLLDAGNFVGFVQDRIDDGWDYVAIDEIGANPGAPIDWTNGSARSNKLVAGLIELSDSGYGRRVMPYFASSTLSNAQRAQSVRNIIETVPAHARIGMLELYRRTSDGHSVQQHRDYFHGRAANFEMAVPGINDHLITVLAVSNRNDAQPHQYLDVPAQDLDSITRQFQALHQENSLTRRHPGIGTYSWGATRHWEGHYTVYELAAHVRELSNWYAVHFGVSAPGDAPPPGEPPPPPPAPDPSQVKTVYRSYHPQKRSHKYALSEAEATAGGYALEGAAFAIAAGGGGSRAPLHQCLKSNGKLLYTTDAGCEGAGTNHGALGYVGGAPEGGTRPLYRLYHSGNGAHFYAANDAEKEAAIGLGYKYEGIQGYVW